MAKDNSKVMEVEETVMETEDSLMDESVCEVTQHLNKVEMLYVKLIPAGFTVYTPLV